MWMAPVAPTGGVHVWMAPATQVFRSEDINGPRVWYYGLLGPWSSGFPFLLYFYKSLSRLPVSPLIACPPRQSGQGGSGRIGKIIYLILRAAAGHFNSHPSALHAGFASGPPPRVKQVGAPQTARLGRRLEYILSFAFKLSCRMPFPPLLMTSPL